MLHKKKFCDTPKFTEQALDIVWPIVFSGGLLGLLLSWSVLSGDAAGRVNLLYLLLVYLLIPIFSVITSVISLLFGQGINLARLLSKAPFWSYQIDSLLRKINQLKLTKYWFLMQSQAAAIAFSIMSLLVFMVLLLATDINFVWRSTVLNAADLLPWLEAIANPWSFWIAAQPDLQLLEMTQDSRLVSANVGVSVYANWWQFILATQLFYSFFLRFVLLLFSRWGLKRLIASDIESRLQLKMKQQKETSNSNELFAPIINHLPKGITINNWANIPFEVLEYFPQLNFNPDNLIIAGPQASQAEHIVAQRWQNDQLIVVKSWEPPLAELEDFMQNSQGYILPIDWKQSQTGNIILVNPKHNHLSEWQRLTLKLPQWQIYLPEKLL